MPNVGSDLYSTPTFGIAVTTVTVKTPFFRNINQFKRGLDKGECEIVEEGVIRFPFFRIIAFVSAWGWRLIMVLYVVFLLGWVAWAVWAVCRGFVAIFNVEIDSGVAVDFDIACSGSIPKKPQKQRSFFPRSVSIIVLTIPCPC
jgi:hypothetical protein